MGDVKRFQRGKQVASYLGLIPREYSSGGHQRLGSISKQGNGFMRMLLVEAAQVAVRCDPQMRQEYLHRCHKKTKGVAKVAAAWKLAIRLYWMLHTNRGYPEVVRVESSSRVPLVSASYTAELIGRSRPLMRDRGIRMEASRSQSRPNRWLAERPPKTDSPFEF